MARLSTAPAGPVIMPACSTPAAVLPVRSPTAARLAEVATPLRLLLRSAGTPRRLPPLGGALRPLPLVDETSMARRSHWLVA